MSISHPASPPSENVPSRTVRVSTPKNLPGTAGGGLKSSTCPQIPQIQIWQSCMQCSSSQAHINWWSPLGKKLNIPTDLLREGQLLSTEFWPEITLNENIHRLHAMSWFVNAQSTRGFCWQKFWVGLMGQIIFTWRPGPRFHSTETLHWSTSVCNQSSNCGHETKLEIWFCTA